MDKNPIFYDKKSIAVLFKQLDNIALLTLHKIMSPMCGHCMAEKGKALIEGRIPWGK